jgi:simple sugar transport system ATP-binding protein
LAQQHNTARQQDEPARATAGSGPDPGAGRGAVPTLAMAGIEKSFGPVRALDGVDLTVAAREVHGLLGGNGAGKTTLMNVLYGLYAADAGSVAIDGAPVTIGSPRDAIAAGVGMVHQSFLQVDTFTVTENVVLGTAAGALRTNLAPARRRIAELSERFGLAVDPGSVVGDLPVGVRQRVEILKALYRGARILVLDEPTTNLTPQEVDALFGSLRTIVDEGMSVILITHKIRETMAACDAMTVMRDGRRVATLPRAATSAAALAALLVGVHTYREVDPARLTAALGAAVVGDPVPDLDDPAADPPHARPAEPAVPATPVTGGAAGASARVAVTALTAAGDAGVPAEHEVTLALAPGEIHGVSGVAGNGQTELAEAVTGVRPLRAGSVLLDGAELAGRPTADWLAAGVTYVPEDRQRDGILPSASIAETLMLGGHRAAARAGLIDWRAARADATDVIGEYSIRAPGHRTAAGQLSGGNIQRLILARAFRRRPRLLVLHNPTRGLDLASTQFVYERVRQAAADGCAVLVISEDLDEIMALSHRISIIYSGRLVAAFDRGEADPYQLGRLMTGVAG